MELTGLINSLNDPDIAVRKRAAGQLKKYPDQEAVLAAYLQALPAAASDLAIIILSKIERLGRGKTGVGRSLLPMLTADDYLLRSRTFISLGRLGDISVGEELLRFINREPEEVWQIWALECLHHLPDSRWIKPLAEFLRQKEKPLLVRGSLWLIGALGGPDAVDVIASFLADPAGRLVKDELALEALQMAVSSWPGGEDFLRNRQAASPQLARVLRYMIFPADDKTHFRVLPYPDYFLDQAKDQGLTPEAFKKLSFWDRD